MNCYFDDYHIVGVVVDSSIVVAVDWDKMGEWESSFDCYYDSSTVDWKYCGCCRYGVGNSGYIGVGGCDFDCCCHSSVGCWGESCCYLGGVVYSWRWFVVGWWVGNGLRLCV